MTMFRKSLMGIFLLLLVGLTACLSKEEYTEAQIKAFIQQELDLKVTNFIKQHRQRCQDDLLQLATKQVDSILLVDAFYKRDTTLKPHQPGKPAHPVIKIIEDTTKVKPFFKPKKQEQSSKSNTDQKKN